ncbi:MAG: GNAT family N-acetyltransferase [Candidatus Bathyarchaeota archaeon]
MRALTRLGDEMGEIKRMYNRPLYRIRGLGKQMLHRQLETGREYGITSFMLDTPKWAYAAQHIYKSVGFKEIEEYPESQIPPDFKQYWMFMEKR